MTDYVNVNGVILNYVFNNDFGGSIIKIAMRVKVKDQTNSSSKASHIYVDSVEIFNPKDPNTFSSEDMGIILNRIPRLQKILMNKTAEELSIMKKELSETSCGLIWERK